MARICILLPLHWGAARGGAEYQAHLLAEHIVRSTGHEVVYLARNIPVDTSGYTYRIVRFAGPVLPGGQRWGKWVDSRALYTALKDIRPDVIIHMVATAYTGVAALYARRHNTIFYWYLASDMDIEPVPNVGVRRSPARFLDRMIFRYGARSARYIIAQTATQNTRMQETLHRSATLLVGNFLPPPTEAIRKAVPFTVVWIANLKKLKRPDLFVELAKRCAGHGDIQFRMAGRPADKDLAEQVRHAAASLDNLTYLEELTIEEVEQELSSAHVLVNTSDYEGFPNTFIQAWLRAVPVFSIHVDPDGVMANHGIGVKAEGFEALVQGITSASGDRSAVAAMGDRARAYGLAHHSLANADRLIEHIESTLKSATPQLT